MGVPVIFQKYIAGEEINVCALAKEGEMIGAVVMKNFSYRQRKSLGGRNNQQRRCKSYFQKNSKLHQMEQWM